MARRRMISEELIYDEDLNKISIEAEHLFFRMLSVADDFGFLPANEYTLKKLTNIKDKVSKNFQVYFDEILKNQLGSLIVYKEKQYFLFKMESFDRINSYLIAKRTQSEYTKLSKSTIESENFLEITGISRQLGCIPIERYKYKDISIKNKEEEGKFKKFWESYPRKEGRGKAEQSFNKFKVDDILLKTMLSTISLYKETDQWIKDKGRFIPLPATWLNQRRWEDNPQTSVPVLRND